MEKDKFIKMANGSILNFSNLKNEDSARGLSPVRIQSQYTHNFQLKEEFLHRISSDLRSQLDEVIINGLKLKGFAFPNNLELEIFIIRHCRCEDNIEQKQKVYYVDDIPFLLHNYASKIERQSANQSRSYIFSASLGSYSYI